MEITREELEAMIKQAAADAVAPLRERATEWGERIRADRPVQSSEPGIGVGRLIRAMAAGRGDPERAAHWAKRVLDDEQLAKALATTPDSAGGFIIPPGYVAEIIELLRPASVIRRMNPVVMPMPNGTLQIPALASGAAASYIGENTNIPVTQPAFRQVELKWRKLAALVPISNDLLRYNNPQVDAVVRDDLVAALAQRSDLAFIRSDGTSGEPKGLRYQAAASNVIAANATVNLDTVTTDLSRLVLALQEANVRFIRPGWLMAPRTAHYLMTVRDGNGNYAFRDEMLAGRLWGYPYAVTTQIPTNLGEGTNESEVYFADFADVVIGDSMNITLDVSREAAYHDGTNVVAAFSLDQTVIRAIAEHDLAVRHAESVAVLTGVTWGASS
ncbi:MAG: phage major capsid protein [Micromonosporaceae bacterium]|nr:phage major capsid protein [Micromonosporaceae bacterium]